MPNKTIRNKIESIMIGPGEAPLGSLATVLFWLSRVYGGLQNLRSHAYRHHLIASRRLPCRVVSIGNITVGGTGKTPMTLFVAERLRQSGYRVVVISRGYGGSARKTGTIISDAQGVCADPETAGDEPYLLASHLKGIPVIVGRNRYCVGQMAMDRFQPQVIVLDDGFQHMRLVRDVDLVLLDYHKPFGNCHLLPRGTLREPQSALERSDAIVLTRCPQPPRAQSSPTDRLLKYPSQQTPVFASSHAPCLYRLPGNKRASAAELSLSDIVDQPGVIPRNPVVAFSGIARNDDFRQTLDALGFNIARFIEFPDHHWYADRDLATIEQAAGQSSATRLVTTEKDFVRIAHRKTWPLELVVVGVRISFGQDEDRFLSFLKNRIGN
jgi:tetraacyldisaccharide 4'-kinase